jgi:hypothetical protein
MTKHKLYLLILILSIIGFIWLIINFYYFTFNNTYTICFFRNTTGIACPACGSTNAVIALLKGNLLQAISINALSLIILPLLFILPIWIIYDLFTKKQSFYNCYNLAEQILKRKQVAIPIIILVLFFWIWNIKKHL